MERKPDKAAVDREAAINGLAYYLTEIRLVHSSSIGLKLTERDVHMAEEFFKLREQFGVSGYATQTEATMAIKRQLGVI